VGDKTEVKEWGICDQCVRLQKGKGGAPSGSGGEKRGEKNRLTFGNTWESKEKGREPISRVLKGQVGALRPVTDPKK